MTVRIFKGYDHTEVSEQINCYLKEIRDELVELHYSTIMDKGAVIHLCMVAVKDDTC